MPKQDFFAFCTGLKPIELKAIGALSRVEHLAAGEMVYNAGDPGDTLFIINRGVVEMLDETNTPAGSGTFLSRGDVFGEVEVFTEQPRRQGVRACEPVSLQCVKRGDFAEIVERLPTFFRFLCDELAHRLADARMPTPALASVQCLQLSGSLAKFDLITIYQTIVNSSQTGELSIRSDTGELISTFYFEAGQPRSGVFDHLIGEEAFWQLFLAEDIPGTFAFSSRADAPAERSREPEITRAPSDILIHALQGRDEIHALKRELPDPAVILERQKPHLSADNIGPASLRPLVEQIWRYADKRRVPLRSLYPRFDFCELKIYQAVSALVRSGHLRVASAELADKVA